MAHALQIPKHRYQHWLQLLEYVELVERNVQGYETSPTAQAAVPDAYSQEPWALLVREARGRFPAMCNLAQHVVAVSPDKCSAKYYRNQCRRKLAFTLDELTYRG